MNIHYAISAHVVDVSLPRMNCIFMRADGTLDVTVVQLFLNAARNWMTMCGTIARHLAHHTGINDVSVKTKGA